MRTSSCTLLLLIAASTFMGCSGLSKKVAHDAITAYYYSEKAVVATNIEIMEIGKKQQGETQIRKLEYWPVEVRVTYKKRHTTDEKVNVEHYIVYKDDYGKWAVAPNPDLP